MSQCLKLVRGIGDIRGPELTLQLREFSKLIVVGPPVKKGPREPDSHQPHSPRLSIHRKHSHSKNWADHSFIRSYNMEQKKRIKIHSYWNLVEKTGNRQMCNVYSYQMETCAVGKIK